VLFVGLGCAEKGLFDALEGVRLANLARPGAFRFTALGPFASARDAEAFHRASAPLGDSARHAGFVSVEERNQLFRRTDVLTFPSYYPYEGQPAVILEALAHDLPIVTTRWRGIPEHLPERHVHFVDPRAPEQIAAALQVVRDEGPPGGATRARYLETFTQQRHLAAVKTAISNVLRP
jgi:glycosyltransferase involved in cell wall biosynthesis